MRRAFERLVVFGPNGHEGNAADQRQAAENRRKWNGLGGVLGGVDRSNVDDFFTLGMGDSLVRQCQDAGNDQDNSQKCRNFHRWPR